MYPNYVPKNREIVINKQNMQSHHYAVYRDDVESIIHSVKVMGVDVDENNEYGWTMLESAILGKHINVISALVSLGADINRPSTTSSRPTDKFSPLETSLYCTGYKPRVFHLLCYYGASVYPRIYKSCVQNPELAEARYVLQMPIRDLIVRMIAAYKKNCFPLNVDICRILFKHCIVEHY